MRLQPVLLAALVALPGAAMADVPDSEIVRCATMMDDTARLACYDAIAASRSAEAVAAAEKRKAAAAERAEREAKEKAERQQQAFGAEQVPSREGGGEGSEEVDQISATISEVLKDARGNYIVVLSNGQMWRQLDGTLYGLRSGDEVEIKRRALSGYKMTIKKLRRTVAASRMR
jgi:hypothetical protein